MDPIEIIKFIERLEKTIGNDAKVYLGRGFFSDSLVFQVYWPNGLSFQKCYDRFDLTMLDFSIIEHYLLIPIKRFLLENKKEFQDVDVQSTNCDG